MLTSGECCSRRILVGIPSCPKIAKCLLLLLVLLSRATPDLNAQCVKHHLTTSPSWISTIAWDAINRQLLINDPAQGLLLAYRVDDAGMSQINIQNPKTITAIDDGFVVKTSRNTALWLDKSLQKRGPITLRANGLGSLYANWIARGTELVGFGSVTHMPRNLVVDPNSNVDIRDFKLGFVSARLGKDGKPLGAKLLRHTESSDYYLIGYQFFAANRSDLFYIDMTGDSRGASLVKVKNGHSHVVEDAIPERFLSIPKLDTKSHDSVSELFEYIEQQNMVAGVYGKGNAIYVLARMANDIDANTIWLLYKIDPGESENSRKNRQLGVVQLPTSSSHIMLQPIEDRWLVIERGAIEDWGNQEIDSILQIDSSWIDNPVDSPLQWPSPKISTCREPDEPS